MPEIEPLTTPAGRLLALTRGWLTQAGEFKARAHRLGNCAAGKEMFGDACMLERCASQVHDVLAAGPGNTAAAEKAPAGTWPTAEQDPAVAERGNVAELPCPAHSVWRKTCPACREIPDVTNKQLTALAAEELEAASRLADRFTAGGINAEPGLGGSVVLYASDIEAAHFLRFLEVQRPDLTRAPGENSDRPEYDGRPRAWHTGPDWTGWVRPDEVRDALAALPDHPVRDRPAGTGGTAVKLEWNQLPGAAGELAAGDDWTYLITQDDRAMVLTRWEGGDRAQVDVARQAALYAIRFGGAYSVVPEAAESVRVHLRGTAQAYESGLDVSGQPAWRHGYQVPESHPDVTGADPDAFYR